MISDKKNESNLKKLDLDEIIGDKFKELNDTDLPEIIVNQFDKLKKLETLNKDSKKAAMSARKHASDAKAKTVGWFNKKDIIEDLQSVGVGLAEAVQIMTKAQEVSFDHHTELAQISKYLFGIGVSNISANRYVVRELEMRLKGASEEELSELARQELTTVVMQLKAQEDVIKKQENFAKLIKKHDEEITKIFDENKEIDEKIDLRDEEIKAKIQVVEEKVNSEIEGANAKIQEVQEKLNTEVEGTNAKIQEGEEKLNTELELANVKIQEFEEKLNTEVEETNAKIQEVEEKINSEIELANGIINKNEKHFDKDLNSQKRKINLLALFLIINILLIISLTYYILQN